MRRPRVRTAIFAVVSAGSAAACGGSDDGTATERSGAQKPTTTTTTTLPDDPCTRNIKDNAEAIQEARRLGFENLRHVTVDEVNAPANDIEVFESASMITLATAEQVLFMPWGDVYGRFVIDTPNGDWSANHNSMESELQEVDGKRRFITRIPNARLRREPDGEVVLVTGKGTPLPMPGQRYAFATVFDPNDAIARLTTVPKTTLTLGADGLLHSAETPSVLSWLEGKGTRRDSYDALASAINAHPTGLEPSDPSPETTPAEDCSLVVPPGGHRLNALGRSLEFQPVHLPAATVITPATLLAAS